MNSPRNDRVTVVQSDGTSIELTPKEARTIALKLLSAALLIDRNMRVQLPPVRQAGG